MATEKQCPVGKALEQLEPNDRHDVESVLDNSVSSVVLSRWFTEIRDFKGCSVAAVNAHRKGDCDCQRQRQPNGHRRRR